MAQRRQTSSTSSTGYRTRKYSLRRPQTNKRRVIPAFHRLQYSSPSPSPDRPVLVPLHPNLRRLPSRAPFGNSGLEVEEFQDMHAKTKSALAQAGMKRKRVASVNENGYIMGRSARSSGRNKRLRTVSQQVHSSSSEESDSQDSNEEASGMDVDSTQSHTRSDESDGERDGSEEEDSTDDFLINEAASRRLLRLRKDELVRLYSLAGLSAEDAESLTKPEIVDAIVSARDDLAELPPSSPPGQSSDGGGSSDADGEETDMPQAVLGIGAPGRWGSLRRRATFNEFGRSNEHCIRTRTLSIGNLNSKSTKTPTRSTRACSSRSSPTISGGSHVAPLPSPPATRLRSRKVSASTELSRTSGKGKGKQVEFNEDIEVCSVAEESDLTELEESDADTQSVATAPTSRKVGMKRQKDAHVNAIEKDSRRRTPMRKAKGKIKSLKEVDSSADEEDELNEIDEDEEVDQLISSPSPTPPPPGRRTPVRRRLRPRRVQQTHTPPSDGDDEGGEDDDHVEDVDGEEEEEDEDDTETAVDNEESLVNDEAKAETFIEPRVLRNGKVLGDGDTTVDGDAEEDLCEEGQDEEENSTEGDDEDDLSPDADAIEDPDAEGELEEYEEPMEDVDLTVVTAKTLVRMRRDDLVRMCEARDLDVAGTKPQLAEALLQWRSNNSVSGFSSPSSAGTVRPPSTMRPKRHKRSNGQTKSTSQTPPVLLRTHVHVDGPRTPPVSVGRKEGEPELELDLESLGLEDREIPPDRLTKLEKIGSGGFKDVYVGKLKGRKVAIAEFRGQLSTMDIKELKLLGGFDHPNIVRFLGVSIPENTRETPVMIVSELCSNGDLFDYVRNVSAPSLHKVLQLMLDIARGLEYLHMRKPSVIHRDCKSSNILITSRGTAKIADFGLAKVKQSTRSMVRSLVGTVNWQAPELWHAHPKYNHKVDVFSCAMVYWEILQWHLPNKKFPWEGMNEHAIYEIVGAKRQRPSIAGLRKQWCPEIIDLLERMWAHEHQDRPTMSEVVEELKTLVSKR